MLFIQPEDQIRRRWRRLVYTVVVVVVMSDGHGRYRRGRRDDGREDNLCSGRIRYVYGIAADVITNSATTMKPAKW